MDDEISNLRQLVMRRQVAGSRNNGREPMSQQQQAPLISQTNRYYDSTNSNKIGNGPLIQKVGPEYSKMHGESNKVVLKVQHKSQISNDFPSPGFEMPKRVVNGDPRVGRKLIQNTEYIDKKSSENVTLRSSSYDIGMQQKGISGNSYEEKYQSLPRRMSSHPPNTVVDRRQSFQDHKKMRDKFTGQVDFKSTLRSDSKDRQTVIAKQEELWIRKNEKDKRERQLRAKQTNATRDERSRRGYFIEADFNFRSPPSTRDNSRERKVRSTEFLEFSDKPKRGDVDSYKLPSHKKRDLSLNDLHLLSPDAKSPMSDYYDQLSPDVHYTSADPLSPRKVEFADVTFKFKPPDTAQPLSRCQSPLPKSILRQTYSDPKNTSQLAANKEKNNLEKEYQKPLTRPTSLIIPNNDSSEIHYTGTPQSLVKIMLPDDKNDYDSEDTITNESQEPKRGLSLKSLGERKDIRKVPPALAECNRSKSFPPPKNTKTHEDMHSIYIPQQSKTENKRVSIINDTSQRSNIDLSTLDSHELNDWLEQLEMKVLLNNGEIKSLRTMIAECLRKINSIEDRIGAEPNIDHQSTNKDMLDGSRNKIKINNSSTKSKTMVQQPNMYNENVRYR